MEDSRRLKRRRTPAQPRGVRVLLGAQGSFAFRAQDGAALRNRLFLLVDVVADHAAEDTSDRGADEASLLLVLAGHRANHGAGARADRRVTLGVLLRDGARLRRNRRRAAAARTGAAARAAAGAARATSAAARRAGGAVRLFTARR